MYWFHLSATVIWIGGIFFLLFIAIPSTKKIPAQEAGIIMGYIAKKFTLFVNYSIVILFMTGIILTIFNKNFTSMENFYNPWMIILFIKHVIVISMIIIHLFRLFVLSNKIEKAPSMGKKTVLQKRSLHLVKINLALGVTVLLLSGITSILRG